MLASSKADTDSSPSVICPFERFADCDADEEASAMMRWYREYQVEKGSLAKS